MTKSDKDNFEGIMPKIAWRDVIKLDSAQYSDSQSIAMVQALDEIEGTKTGQTLLNGVQLRNQELAAIFGAKDDRIMVTNGEGFGYDTSKNIVIANPDYLRKNKVVSFASDGVAFEEELSSVLFHELSHHCDVKAPNITQEINNTIKGFVALQKTTGATISEQKKEFSADLFNPFFQSLSEQEQQTIAELNDAAKNKNMLQSDFAKLFESKKHILFNNPQLKLSNDYSNKIASSLYEAEIQTVMAANEFNREIGLPDRSGYLSTKSLDNNLGKVGPSEQPSHQQIDYAKWEASKIYPQVESDGKLILRDLRVTEPKNLEPQKFFIPPELLPQLESVKIGAGFDYSDTSKVSLAASPSSPTSKAKMQL